MKDQPLISVLMGVYYHRPDTALLERSVCSILAQSISDFEFLICDDGSSNEAIALLERMAEEDGRIRLIRAGNLFSLPSKLNACLNAARGSWVARMDDDDYAHPQRFEKQIDYLKRHPKIAFVGCNVNLCQNSQCVGIRQFPEYPEVRDFYFTQPYIHPTLVFRKNALLTVGGYSEDAYCLLCEDYDLLLRLYAAGFRGANLQEILFNYTIPTTTKGNRTLRYRWNETVVRWRRFGQLRILPRTLPYVVKPILVGLLPTPILQWLKEKKYATSQKENDGYLE